MTARTSMGATTKTISATALRDDRDGDEDDKWPQKQQQQQRQHLQEVLITDAGGSSQQQLDLHRDTVREDKTAIKRFNVEAYLEHYSQPTADGNLVEDPLLLSQQQQQQQQQQIWPAEPSEMGSYTTLYGLHPLAMSVADEIDGRSQEAQVVDPSMLFPGNATHSGFDSRHSVAELLQQAAPQDQVSEPHVTYTEYAAVTEATSPAPRSQPFTNPRQWTATDRSQPSLQSVARSTVPTQTQAQTEGSQQHSMEFESQQPLRLAPVTQQLTSATSSQAALAAASPQTTPGVHEVSSSQQSVAQTQVLSPIQQGMPLGGVIVQEAHEPSLGGNYTHNRIHVAQSCQQQQQQQQQQHHQERHRQKQDLSSASRCAVQAARAQRKSQQRESSAASRVSAVPPVDVSHSLGNDSQLDLGQITTALWEPWRPAKQRPRKPCSGTGAPTSMPIDVNEPSQLTFSDRDEVGTTKPQYFLNDGTTFPQRPVKPRQERAKQQTQQLLQEQKPPKRKQQQLRKATPKATSGDCPFDPESSTKQSISLMVNRMEQWRANDVTQVEPSRTQEAQIHVCSLHPDTANCGDLARSSQSSSGGRTVAQVQLEGPQKQQQQQQSEACPRGEKLATGCGRSMASEEYCAPNRESSVTEPPTTTADHHREQLVVTLFRRSAASPTLLAYEEFISHTAKADSSKAPIIATAQTAPRPNANATPMTSILHHCAEQAGAERVAVDDRARKDLTATPPSAPSEVGEGQPSRFPRVDHAIRSIETALQQQPLLSFVASDDSKENNNENDDDDERNELFVLRFDDLLGDVEMTDADDLSDLCTEVDDDQQLLLGALRDVRQQDSAACKRDALGNFIGPRGTLTMPKRYFDGYVRRIIEQILGFCEYVIDTGNAAQLSLLIAGNKKMKLLAELALKIFGASRTTDADSARQSKDDAEKLHRFMRILPVVVSASLSAQRPFI